MNERERPLDTNVTTATLAGLDEPHTDENTRNDTVEKTEKRNGSERMVDNTSTSPMRRSSANDESTAPLFPVAEATELHTRWDAIQVGFVDEPRRAVEQADALVAAAMKHLAEIFAEERSRLEGQWDRGDSVSTEDLRVALRRYRSFFGRLVAV